MWRFVPPAGAPVPLAKVLRAGRELLAGGAEDCFAAFADHLHVRHVFAANSGRTALWMILRALHRLRPERDVVAIPGYTCFSVPASVVRAGLKVHPFDLSPETLEPDYEQLEGVTGDELLAVLSANLFGYLNDMTRLREIARTKGAFVVDDAAQALGGARGGEAAGMGGDVGFFSLARGKSLPAGEGGVIVTNSEEIAQELRGTVAELPPCSATHAAGLLLKVMAGSVLLNPNFYWLPNALPFLKLGITEFDPSFPARGLARLAGVLFQELLGSLEKLNRDREAKARAIADALNGNHKFRVPAPAADCRPTYIRLPLLARDNDLRERTIRALGKAGIGASAFYPAAVCDIEGLAPHLAESHQHCRQAEDLAHRLLTLPTHPLVTTQDVKRMAETIGRM